MKQDGDTGLEVHHTKPWRLAEKLESYMGVIMAAVAVVLLAVLAYGLTKTGAGTPTWMR
jgi:hypothetical protein